MKSKRPKIRGEHAIIYAWLQGTMQYIAKGEPEKAFFGLMSLTNLIIDRRAITIANLQQRLAADIGKHTAEVAVREREGQEVQ